MNLIFHWTYYDWVNPYMVNIVGSVLFKGEYQISNDIDMTELEAKELFLEHIALLPHLQDLPYNPQNLIYYTTTN